MWGFRPSTACREEFLLHCQEEAGSDEDKGVALFNVFDDDNSGTMDFPEFLMASNALKLRLVPQRHEKNCMDTKITVSALRMIS